MNDFLLALNTVLPLLLLMSLGWFCRRVGLLTETLVKGVNQLVFKLFLPVSLCVSVMNTPYDTAVSVNAFLLAAIGLAADFGILFLLIPRIEKDRKKIGVMIQGMARGNYAFFGIPLVAMLFPGRDTSLASLMVIVTIPVYNILSVVALCVFGEGEIRLGKVLLNILKNPLIIGTVFGYAFWMLRFQPPAFIRTTMADLAKVATPLALFTLGGAIQFASAKGHKKQLLITVPWKLIISPLVFMGIGIALGLRDVALACTYIAFGAPTAVSSYPMAQQMGGDGELAAEIVAISSAFCILTTFLFVFAMKSMGLI